MANQPLVAGAPTAAGPMGPPRLQTLLLSTTAFTAGGSAGDVLAAITGQTPGSTIGVAPSDASGLFAVAGGGSQLVKGLNWPISGASTPTVALRETLAGAANSPKDTAVGVMISSHVDVFLPTVGSGSFTAVFGMAKIVSGYAAGQPLYTLTRPDNATFNVLAGVGNIPANYAAAEAWAVANSSSDKIIVTTWYDQMGTAATYTAVAATAPVWDPRQIWGGIIPMTHDGNPSTVNGLQNAVFMQMGGMSINVQAMTVFDVLDPYFSYQRSYYWSARTSNNTTEVANVYASGNGGVTFQSANLGPQPRAMPSIITTVGSATASKLFMRENKYTGGAYTAGTAVNFYIGTGLAGNDYFERGRRWAWMVAPASFSDADVATIQTALTGAFTIPNTFTSRLVLSGDSIIEGYLCTYAYNISQTLNLPATVELFNVAVGGEQMTSPAADNPSAGYGGFNPKFTAHVGNLYTSAYGAGKCLLLIEDGTNDLGASSLSATALQNTGRGPAIASAHALGYTVAVTTILPRADTNWTGAMETQRNAFNPLVRANAGGGQTGTTGVADIVIDIASDGIMGDPNVPSTAGGLWNTDLLHPTSAGTAGLATRQYRPAFAAQLGFV
jgi:hypothetical protein